MRNHIYPRAEGRRDQEQVISDSQIANVLITARDKGEHSLDEALCYAIGACGSIKAAKRVQEEINAEIDALEAVKPASTDTLNQFKDKLSAKAKRLDVNRWLAALMVKHECETWVELRSKLAPVEVLP